MPDEAGGDALIKHRFFYLLISLIAMLLISPFARTFGPSVSWFGPALITLLFAAILIAAVFTVSRNRKSAFTVGAISVLAIALQGVSQVEDYATIFLFDVVLTVGVLTYTVVVSLRYLFTVDTVTHDTIAASFCVYLILAILWALIFTGVELLAPGSFSVNTSASVRSSAEFPRFGGDDSASSIYFSLVTITTLGFGDITPVKPFARMLTAIEATMGQMYLAVLVARLVGMHIAQGRSPRDE